MHRIAASILSADRRQLPDAVRQLAAAGVDAIHMNVVQADERPNLDLAHLACASIRAACALPIHVHLRVPASTTLLERFAEAGADMLILHPERGQDIQGLLATVRAAGCRAGLAFAPGDGLDALPAWLAWLDVVHVSCALPASTTRPFLPAGLTLIAQARSLIDAAGGAVRLQADGDIGMANIGLVAAAGADDVVVGRALFGNASSSWPATLAAMRSTLATAHATRVPA